MHNDINTTSTSTPNGTKAKRPHKVVFHIQEDAEGKSHWQRVGSAFVNKDGSLNVLLKSYPQDGKLHTRESKFDRAS